MSQKYADIIIDISHEGVDKTFEYKIPEELSEQVQVGSVVKVPFGQGNRTRQGYVIAVKDSSKWDPDKMKSMINEVHDRYSYSDRYYKILSDYSWYYICTMPLEDAARLKTGNTYFTDFSFSCSHH